MSENGNPIVETEPTTEQAALPAPAAPSAPKKAPAKKKVAKKAPAPAATTTAAPKKKAAKKSAKKAAAKKAPAKKTAKKKASGEAKDRGPSKTQIAILKVLNRSSKGLTRSQLSDRLDGAFVGSDMMGHLNSDPKPASLIARGLVKFAPQEEEGAATTYAISANGKKFLESVK